MRRADRSAGSLRDPVDSSFSKLALLAKKN
jgi:hypothetical protein